ncbi:MAG TPA: transglutaminase-like cysteine peptidase [Salinarimonas sp.]|nr:transglutaminase-like cysteine peptidase [Salinarimonas sp.]
MTRLLAAAVAFVCLSSLAVAGPRLVEGAAAPPLPAWVPFCVQSYAECAVDTSEPAVIPLTADSRELLDAVNRYVNRTIVTVADMAHLGVVDLWTLPTDGIGDCEDLQLLKRKMLVEAGLPRRALRMTVVLDRAGDGHAVLTAITSQGDLVLDNLNPEVLPWEATGYVFVKRESQAGQEWFWLDHPTVEVAEASSR